MSVEIEQLILPEAQPSSSQSGIRFEPLKPLIDDLSVKGRGFQIGGDKEIRGPETDWDKRAESYDAAWTRERNYQLRIMEFGGLRKSNFQVLAVAGGGSHFEAALALSVERLDVVDMSMGMVRKGQRIFDSRTIRNGERMGFVQGDALNLPYPDNYFDRVVMRHALHHLAQPQQTINEMARVVKEEGVVVLSDGTPPNMNPAVVEDYRNVFGLKEQRRIVTDQDMGIALFMAGLTSVDTDVYWMAGASVSDWLQYSGLDKETQEQIFLTKLHQSEETNHAYGTRYLLVNGEVVEKKPRGATAWFENPDSGEAIHDLIETWRFAIVIGKKPEAMAPKGWRSGR